MHRIERYGVIALVFLLVTIVAVSLWGERKAGRGVFSLFKGATPRSRVEELVADARASTTWPGETAAVRGDDARLVPMSPAGLESGARTPWAQRGPELDAVRGELESLAARAPLDEAAPSIVPPDEVPALSEFRERPVRPAERAPQGAATKGAGDAGASAATYKVKAGDTLGEIAQRELGSVRRMGEILALNPNLDPNRLVASQVLAMPVRRTAAASVDASASRGAGSEGQGALGPGGPGGPGSALAKKAEGSGAAAPAAVGDVYIVQRGDTLSGIAARFLGSSSRWRELIAANPDVHPDRLITGARLVLPAAEANAVEAPRRESRVAQADTSGARPEEDSQGRRRSKVR